MKKIIYGVYDTKNNEQCVGVFDTAREIGLYFNKSTSSIHSAICRQNKINARFIIIKIKNESEE